MIEVHSLKQLNPADLSRVASGYSSPGKYLPTYTDSENGTSITLQFVPLKELYVKKYDPYDLDTLQRYDHALNMGHSFGAYDQGVLVGLLLAEPYEWNRSLWVHEFHVAETHRNMGIGKRLMECAVESAKSTGLRIIVCETQNTNAIAIQVYRNLAFVLKELIFPTTQMLIIPMAQIAIFMKRRL
ncbi:MAG: GNAT family N-acetyltransferase [Anaerolineales bacterium]